MDPKSRHSLTQSSPVQPSPAQPSPGLGDSEQRPSSSAQKTSWQFPSSSSVEHTTEAPGLVCRKKQLTPGFLSLKTKNSHNASRFLASWRCYPNCFHILGGQMSIQRQTPSLGNS